MVSGVTGVSAGLPGEGRSCRLKKDAVGGGGAAQHWPEMWNGCQHSDPEEPSSGSRAEKGEAAQAKGPRAPG